MLFHTLRQQPKRSAERRQDMTVDTGRHCILGFEEIFYRILSLNDGFIVRLLWCFISLLNGALSGIVAFIARSADCRFFSLLYHG